MTERLKNIIYRKILSSLADSRLITFKDERTIWIIDPHTTKWLIEIDGNRTLQWRGDFFDRVFSIFGMTSLEYSEILKDFFEELLYSDEIQQKLNENKEYTHYTIEGLEYIMFDFIREGFIENLLINGQMVHSFSDEKENKKLFISLFIRSYYSSEMIDKIVDLVIRGKLYGLNTT
jgi:hypothetical protein